mgnify:FL=1
MQKQTFKQHQTIFKAGDTAGTVFLLVRGSVGIFLPTNETKDPNFVIQENEIFGEMGVIDDELRMADARCLEECDVISVTKDEFNTYLNESNIFVRGVVGILSDRLRKIQKPSK